jgi:basic amino acid/polyamine antiporter, APA family
VRRRERSGLFHEVNVFEELPPGVQFRRVLVPMKLGPIGEEMVATAVALAKERDARVDALFVIVVPLEFPIDAPLWDQEEQATASLAEAVLLGEENDVRVEPITVRARAIGQAILEQADERQSELIVLGSSPRWRRQSQFFSPTVDYVLRSAPCEVLVVAFPQGVLEDVL